MDAQSAKYSKFLQRICLGYTHSCKCKILAKYVPRCSGCDFSQSPHPPLGHLISTPQLPAPVSALLHSPLRSNLHPPRSTRFAHPSAHAAVILTPTAPNNPPSRPPPPLHNSHPPNAPLSAVVPDAAVGPQPPHYPPFRRVVTSRQGRSVHRRSTSESFRRSPVRSPPALSLS